MEYIIGLIHQGLSFIIPLVILLGLLIFVHELGHFLVAKYFGVRVEVFSLGFGKKLFKYKKGDTEYCLSVIPFGGYVKMFGDEPHAEVSEADKSAAFNYKPVGQRIAVVLAGPLMNFFFAILLFTIIALVGEETISPILGTVPTSSKAYSYGFRIGDKILKIEGKAIISWDDIQSEVEAHKNSTLSFVVDRNGQDIQIQAKTETAPNKNILSSEAYVGEIDGLGFTSSSSTIGIAGTNTAAYKAGLRLGDRITAVDNQKTETFDEVLSFIAKSNQKDVQLTIQPGTEKKPEYTITLSKTVSDPVALLQSFGIESSDLYVSKVVEKTPAEKAGIKEGDKIISINGAAVTNWQEIVNTIQSYKAGERPFELVVRRDLKEQKLEITPELIDQQTPTGKDKKVYALGIVTAMVPAIPKTFVMSTHNPLQAITTGITKSVFWTKATIMSFVRLVQKKVSAKSIGGPIMIGQLASKTFQIGLSPFLKIMAIISINLFVLNLLPVPVLDGGHLVFYLVELVKGTPLSVRKMEIAQQIGFFILLTLMVFALFNDVTRLFQ